MNKKIKDLIVVLMATTILGSTIGCENEKSKEVIAPVTEEKEKEVEVKEEKITALSPTKGNLFGLKYDIIGENYGKDMLLGNTYTKLEGVTTFRGNNLRNSPSYGISNISENTLKESWKLSTSFSKWGGGSGWTGQPSIVKWPEEVKKTMNIKEEFKNKKDFTEVIYASLDGGIYFADLETGKPSRDKIVVGNPIKGSLSIDSRGIPFLYVGEGIPENGAVGFNIYSLIDGKKLYELEGNDRDSYRGWPAFDSSSLIYGEGDTVILGGENGVLYLIKLNTNYDKDNNTIKISPKFTKYRYKIPGGEGALGIENSVAVYRNLVYFADNNGDIQCVDLNTMTPFWVVRTGDDTDATITIDVEDNIPYLYTGTEVDHQGTVGLSRLRKINGLTGEEIWKREYKCESIIGADAVNGGLLATPVVGKNNIKDVVIFSLARYKGFSRGGTLALDKKTGEVKWETLFESYMWSSPVDFYDKDGKGYLIQCDSVGNMFLLDGETGKKLNSIKLNSNIEATPSIFNDKVVVATRGGTIYGIDIK